MNNAAFNEVIHPPTRLRICAILAAFDEVEFAIVRDELDVSDSVLSKQITHLERAGYVSVAKRTRETRQRTWLKLTKDGRRALKAHIAALRGLAESLTREAKSN